jgi:hypothetical protein
MTSTILTFLAFACPLVLLAQFVVHRNGSPKSWTVFGAGGVIAVASAVAGLVPPMALVEVVLLAVALLAFTRFARSPWAFLPLSGMMLAVGLSLTLANTAMQPNHNPTASFEADHASNDSRPSDESHADDSSNRSRATPLPDSKTPQPGRGIKWSSEGMPAGQIGGISGGGHPMPFGKPVGESVEEIPTRGPQPSEIREFHDRAVDRFMKVQGFGVGRIGGVLPSFSLGEVVNAPSNDPTKTPEASRVNVQTETFQLVSLLKHPEPRVYIISNPWMWRGSEETTRPLGEFEQFALKRLESGDELLVSFKGDRTHALGAIRASDKCLKCHDGKRGDLLGAFTYTFRQVAKK